MVDIWHPQLQLPSLEPHNRDVHILASHPNLAVDLSSRCSKVSNFYAVRVRLTKYIQSLCTMRALIMSTVYKFKYYQNRRSVTNYSSISS